MNKITKFIATAVVVAGGIAGLTACTSDANKADENIKTAAEQFEVQRTIVGINGITGKTIFYAEGRCSFAQPTSRRFELVCKYGPNDFRKQVFIMGDQDSVAITQEQSIDVSVYHTRIVLKPENLIPEFDLEVGKQ